MGLALVLFIPTFNALNNSYVTDVTPPPWMPTPEELPKDFQPPDEIPEGWEPPEGDWEIPEEWKDKYKGKMPPGGCGPPVIEPIPELNGKTFRPPSSDNGITPAGDWSQALPFNLHETTVGYDIYVNFSDWRGERVLAVLTSADGNETQEEDAGTGGSPSIFGGAAKDSFLNFQEVVDPNTGKRIAPGEYTLALRMEQPFTGGTVRIEARKGLACGGMLD